MAAAVPNNESNTSETSSRARKSSSSAMNSEDHQRRKSSVEHHDLNAPNVTVHPPTNGKMSKKKKKEMTYYISKEDIQYLIQKTHYTEQELREWHQNFREECPDGILDKDMIMKIYDTISPFGNSKDFVDQIFRIFDKDGDGTIDFKEFMIATDLTVAGTPEQKLKWAFKMYDKDGSGTIELDEMVEVMVALQCFDGRCKDAAAARGKRIFSELDINGDGEISCEEFVRGCMHDPELVRIVTAGGLDPMDEEAE